MSYEILKHTADIRLHVTANSYKYLLSEALAGVCNTLKEHVDKSSPEIVRNAIVESADRTALLVDFLNEALALAHINKEVYIGVIFTHFSDTALRAQLTGRGVSGFDRDIKAVTYHEAEVLQNEEGKWEVTLVFDI
ncbi:MAG: hypothetical protein A3C80_00195 [Candidatus Ryanbacteria bacterium RIFCSPHIGHO2_02_FULL_45_43]|uniref:Archease domain-containing protein n=1 Tax=Candidatus Ryanbacteria bacterium RIFCSPHIGHO2_01_45_13 TaxID=1802112 RepID=A0A1G2G0C0_9BACT|nr:MAG: hypothetical protein A2718_01580 [Candidatus Ryanbacteria bacterium RIFCSPHIGHO2_01_FULL_44_130]OGZ43759.1 MAG: hypothetical protein A2W41_04700 [Candidatus Ryanbacteria bacterium RIFCSPHIGHO2_01_45_13]OGZ47701.1 MAG: hypothetical protein A3C80_00195 [Candidatus Ryanbacteria bacterium RIFCSPHIGHO2_02_FULL_45_43]OGZ49597.1 MAG: hypothetical protein A3E55_04195 [Candidatus Ryanbacteria bacterium RIFCSPHIGHO2_12_FULL_44_20]OGZ51279.1 MAG: hypothetical protein A3A17_04520 [Candidatus Ryanba